MSSRDAADPTSRPDPRPSDTGARRSSAPLTASKGWERKESGRPPRRSTEPLELRRTLSWLVPFAILVLAIVAVPIRILADEGLPRYRALRAEQADLAAQNDRLRREVRDLQRQVESLRTDPDAVERLARDELGMVRPGEVIFQFAQR